MHFCIFHKQEREVYFTDRGTTAKDYVSAFANSDSFDNLNIGQGVSPT